MNLLVEKVKTEAQPFLAGDRTFWPRPDAKTLKERTFSGGKGVSPSVGLSLQYGLHGYQSQMGAGHYR